MKLLVLVALIVGAAAFAPGEFDEDMYEVIKTGPKAKAVNDAQSFVTCGKHYIMKKCECREPDHCDGCWIRSDLKEDKCVCWTKGGKGVTVRGAVPVATCARALITVESDFKKNPSIGCPTNYSRIGCNLHTFFRHQKEAGLTVSYRDGICTTRGECDDCRIQALCIRSKKA